VRTDVTVRSVRTDEAGGTVELAQRHGSRPVFNAELIAHFDAAGALTAVNGTVVPAPKTAADARVPAADAARTAVGAVAQALGVDVSLLSSSPPALGVHRTGLAADRPGRTALAWKTTVTGTAVREFVYVDAVDGGVLERFSGIHDARDRTTFNNLSQPDYSLAVKCRGEADPPSGEPDCDNAHTYAGDTYNFYWNGFRRDSIDGRGFPLKSYVHYLSDICPNAFWNGSFMTYCSTFPHDDVTGHEISHGLTEFTANLVYAYQPGALNESFSDIFGEAIDLMNSSENEPNSRWLVAEGVAPGVGLRDMDDPEGPAYGNPASCGSSLYFCGSSDNGGVHTNSGVPNKAFTLMVDGGSLNGVSVSGIGLDKAVAVQFRALTSYLSVYSNFVDDYEALLASCRDLRNKKLLSADPETGGLALSAKISRGDCAQVKNALDAVQMTQAVCTSTLPAQAGPLCATGQTVASLFKDDHETGSPGWTASNDPTLYAADNWQPVTSPVASGTHAWRMNDPLTSCSGGDFTADGYLTSPVVNLTGTTKPVLRFLHDFVTEGGFDGGTVEVLVNGTWTKVPKSAFTLNAYNGSISGAPNSSPLDSSAFTGYRHPADFPTITYYESRADLSSLASQDTDKQVQLRFRFGTDFCNGTDIGWYLDDVEIYECRAATVTVAKP
jgi:bacillolysin